MHHKSAQSGVFMRNQEVFYIQSIDFLISISYFVIFLFKASREMPSKMAASV